MLSFKTPSSTVVSVQHRSEESLKKEVLDHILLEEAVTANPASLHKILIAYAWIIEEKGGNTMPNGMDRLECFSYLDTVPLSAIDALEDKLTNQAARLLEHLDDRNQNIQHPTQAPAACTVSPDVAANVVIMQKAEKLASTDQDRITKLFKEACTHSTGHVRSPEHQQVMIKLKSIATHIRLQRNTWCRERDDITLYPCYLHLLGYQTVQNMLRQIRQEVDDLSRYNKSITASARLIATQLAPKT